MKTARRFMAVILALTALIIAGCSNDRETIDTLFSGFVTGYTDADGYLYKIKDDFGKEYPVAEKIDTRTPYTSYRLVITSTLNADSSLSFRQIVKPISNKAMEDYQLHDSLKKHDPIQIKTAYIGGGFLNILLQIKTQQEKAVHHLEYTHHKSKGKTIFRFYHNAYGDKPIYTRDVYISIPLSSYGLHKNDTVSISYTGFDGDCILKVAYK